MSKKETTFEDKPSKEAPSFPSSKLVQRPLLFLAICPKMDGGSVKWGCGDVWGAPMEEKPPWELGSSLLCEEDEENGRERELGGGEREGECRFSVN